MAENYHALSEESVMKGLGTTRAGISDAEARARLEKHGRNALAKRREFRMLKLALNQFTSFLVLILVFAGAISYMFGDPLDAAAIFAIIFINAALGFFQEYKAESAMDALRKMTALRAVVVRQGARVMVDAEEVVPGDIVLLEAGTKVPADLRLIEAVNLQIDEAVLTGESNPAKKQTLGVAERAPVAERSNMAFANTIVTYGHGAGAVVSTGMNTEFGRVAGMVQEIREEQTPLKRRLEELARQLGIAVVAVIAVLFALGVMRGTGMFEMFMVAVSLGVAAIPEGLPAIITITLGIGIIAMARRNALVRKMPSIEALGSATVICSDKTGTITRNEMVVERIFADGEVAEVSGKGYEPKGEFTIGGNKAVPAGGSALATVLRISAHCSNATLQRDGDTYGVIGDPTEGALVCAAMKAGIKASEERVDEIPFSSERKMMTTVHRSKGAKIAYTKGGIEQVLGACDYVFENGKEAALTAKRRRELLETANRFASEAYRVLGFAYRELKRDEAAEEKMVFAGIAAMRDPPREGVKKAIEICRSAGIKVKIITGDNALTAAAIAKKIGLDGSAVTGNELDAMGKREFAKTVRERAVFARVNPKHKYMIVSELIAQGEVVAATGDGVNDAPALKKANVGIAMGIKGTDVAKEASDIVLKDDDFGTIVVAVKEGRRVYSNIRNFVKYLLSANLNEIAIIAATTIAHLPLAMLPLQILWMNIVTDSLPALALGTERAEKGIMGKPPRNPKEGIIRPILPFLIIATVLGLGATMAAYFYGLGIDEVRGIDAHDLGAASYARTMVFCTVIIFELLLVFGCRFEGKGVLEESPLTNRYLVVAVLASLLLQVAVVHVHWLQGVFRTVALSPFDWAVVFALSAVALAVPYAHNAYAGFMGKRAARASA
ncbi:MAG: cation-transporting P-type ATPase [Candidatus Diapherotrites archaeon]